MDFFQSQIFSSIANLISLLANLCVLGITVYTLYLTAFSKKISFVSMGSSSSLFYGEKFHLSLTNRSLHAIPVLEVFLLKRIDGNFYKISLRKYKEPVVIAPWHVGKIETDSFTTIRGLEDEDGYLHLADIHMDAVIGVDIGGGKVIWVKPYKHAPLKAARKAFGKYHFESMTVSQDIYNDQVLSKSVNYVIHVLDTDINGQKQWNCVFAIIGDKNGFLSRPICGHNGIEGGFKNAKKLKNYLCKTFGIPENCIEVQEFHGGNTFF